MYIYIYISVGIFLKSEDLHQKEASNASESEFATDNSLIISQQNINTLF